MRELILQTHESAQKYIFGLYHYSKIEKRMLIKLEHEKWSVKLEQIFNSVQFFDSRARNLIQAMSQQEQQKIDAQYEKSGFQNCQNQAMDIHFGEQSQNHQINRPRFPPNYQGEKQALKQGGRLVQEDPSGSNLYNVYISEKQKSISKGLAEGSTAEVKIQEDKAWSSSEVRIQQNEAFSQCKIDQELLKCQLQLEQIQRQQRQRPLLIKVNSQGDRNKQLNLNLNARKKAQFYQQQREEITFDSQNEKGIQIQDQKLVENKTHQKDTIAPFEYKTIQENILDSNKQNSFAVQAKEEVQYHVMMQIQGQGPLKQKQVDNLAGVDKQTQNSQVSKDIVVSPQIEISNQQALRDKVVTPQMEMSKQNHRQDIQTVPGTPIIQNLKQQIIHKITDNLQKIFELFKQKLPTEDQIYIIRALYTRYIGPEKVQKPEKNRKNTSTKENKLSQNNILEIANSIELQNQCNRKESLSINNFGPKISSQQVQIQKGIEPLISGKKGELGSKRIYTKRGGQGLGNIRFSDEQKVTKLFIKKGYGLHVARKYLGPNVQNNQYTNLITTIIRQAWRKIQDYVSRIRRIKSMNTNQFKVIKTSLVNCAKWMDPTDLQTLYGFLRTAYQLDSKMPYEEQAVRLYNTCIRKYQQLRGQYQTQMKIRTEKKGVQKLKVSPANSAELGNAVRTGRPVVVTTSEAKTPKKIPTDRQLEDLTSLIKSQMRKNNLGRPNSSVNVPPSNGNQSVRVPMNPPTNFNPVRPHHSSINGMNSMNKMNSMNGFRR